MALRFEKRSVPSRAMLYLVPVGALLLTIVAGAAIFTLLGYQGVAAIRQIFLAPLLDSYRWHDLMVRAVPLVIIGVGLAISYRANVWNIGAEGQYVVGALAATWVALASYGSTGIWVLPAMALAGMAGGAAYASIPAVLRTRFGINEILTSLMFTYASIQLVYYLVRGPWRDPMGMGFPQTRLFSSAANMPILVPGTVLHWGVPIAVAVAVLGWLIMSRSVLGFRIRATGSAPRAARFGGFSPAGTVWMALLTSGALAGLAGMIEVTSSFGRMTPGFPSGHGFTAIIVAFLARLHPLGVIPAALAMALILVGGQLSQATTGLPSAAAGLFQAMLLFFLLAGDILVRYRIKSVPARRGLEAGR